MKIQTIRRLTADLNHNAFTGATFFKGDLYVAFRQGDAHACSQGRLIVLRSRNEGKSFDIVATIRGELDTRDAHLYVADGRMFLVGFEADREKQLFISGSASTANGLNWSPWTLYQGPGVANQIFWRPRWVRGRHYCAAYSTQVEGTITWFDSADGLNWQPRTVIHSGTDLANECFLQFTPDATALFIMRRDHATRRPILASAPPPYTQWSKTELDIPLAGPALWLSGDEIWIGGRWCTPASQVHVALFRVEGIPGFSGGGGGGGAGGAGGAGGRPQVVLQAVLPSGPGADCSYIGVAQHPVNPRRFFLSYYSNHDVPGDPTVSQWDHPDIYLAELLTEAPFLRDWQISRLLQDRSLAGAAVPDPADASLGWQSTAGLEEYVDVGERNFVDVHESVIRGRPGVVYFVADIETGPDERGTIYLGYDGPIRAWLNGAPIFEGVGTNPASPDKTKVAVRFQIGHNRLAIALDTNGGKAWGIFARYEVQGVEGG